MSRTLLASSKFHDKVPLLLGCLALVRVRSFSRDQHREEILKNPGSKDPDFTIFLVLPPNVENHRWRLEALTFALRPSRSFAFGVFGLGYGTVCACACSISHPPPSRRRATTTLNRPRHDAPREQRSPRPNRASRLTESYRDTGVVAAAEVPTVSSRARAKTRRRSRRAVTLGETAPATERRTGCEHPCVCVRVDRRRRQPC